VDHGAGPRAAPTGDIKDLAAFRTYHLPLVRAPVLLSFMVTRKNAPWFT
jgi:hypothetical protein